MVDFVVDELRRRGHEVHTLLPAPGKALPWPKVGVWVGREVAEGRADQGVVLCWTGTGVSIAANKIPGVRAALCGDAETARGARVWNHANVLALSLRTTSEAIATEILERWLATTDGSDDEDLANIALLDDLDCESQTREAK